MHVKNGPSGFLPGGPFFLKKAVQASNIVNSLPTHYAC
jgi:hypothetical protein